MSLKDLEKLQSEVHTDQLQASRIELETIFPPKANPRTIDEQRLQDSTQSPTQAELESESLNGEVTEDGDHALVISNNNNNNNNNDKLPLRIAPPAVIRGINLNSIPNRSTFIAAISPQLPLNDFGMPKHLYRPDLIDLEYLKTAAPEDQQIHLSNAQVELQYHEGFPSINDRPIWEQLDFESGDEYFLFKQYLELPGARQLGLLSQPKAKPQLQPQSLNGEGSQAGSQAGSQEARLDLREVFHCNYWRVRSTANDNFAAAHLMRLREQRILKSENTHFVEAERLLQTLVQHFGSIDWGEVKDPEKYVTILEKLVKLQRLALNQSTQASDKALNSIPNLELIMRRMSKSATGDSSISTNGATNEGFLGADGGNIGKTADIREMLMDPNFTSQAQELILRIHSHSS